MSYFECVTSITALNISSLGFGRASKICVNLDINRDLTMVIFPITVKFLGVQILINFSMSEIFFLRFNSVIFNMSSRSTSIPNDVNIFVQFCWSSFWAIHYWSSHHPQFLSISFYPSVFLTLRTNWIHWYYSYNESKSFGLFFKTKWCRLQIAQWRAHYQTFLSL